jgi:hypothetical protein
MEKQLKTKIENALSGMTEWVGLTLYPPIGETMIQKEGNRMYVNEGRNGLFEDVSEEFYDEMVSKYDSRYKDAKE